MQFDAYQFESHIGCRLLFSTVADGRQVGPMREGWIMEVSPNREFVCLAVSVGPLVAYSTDPISEATEGKFESIFPDMLHWEYRPKGTTPQWFKIIGVDVLDSWEKSETK